MDCCDPLCWAGKQTKPKLKSFATGFGEGRTTCLSAPFSDTVSHQADAENEDDTKTKEFVHLTNDMCQWVGETQLHSPGQRSFGNRLWGADSPSPRRAEPGLPQPGREAGRPSREASGAETSSPAPLQNSRTRLSCSTWSHRGLHTGVIELERQREMSTGEWCKGPHGCLHDACPEIMQVQRRLPNIKINFSEENSLLFFKNNKLIILNGLNSVDYFLDDSI